jgi:hypothetical protein
MKKSIEHMHWPDAPDMCMRLCPCHQFNMSKAAMILLSLHPGPASETSAFNRMRAFNSRPPGFFPCGSSSPAVGAPRCSISQRTSLPKSPSWP